MANTLTSLFDDIYTLMLDPLRANSVMPRLLTSQFSDASAQKGQKIRVDLPPVLAARDVVPGPVPIAPPDFTTASVDVELDSWKEVPFALTDKDKFDIQEGNMPKVVASALATLADTVDTSILLAGGVGACQATGTAATTPFATAVLAMQANKILNQNKVSVMGRHVVFDADAEVNLKALEQFSSGNYVPDTEAMMSAGFSGVQRLGAAWYMDQNVPTQTTPSIASYVTNSTPAVGATTFAIDGGTAVIAVGDVFTLNGDTTQYVVIGGSIGGTSTSITIGAPGLKKAPGDGAAMTFKASHVSNLAFTSDSIAFASRPMPASDAAINSSSLSDPISGLSVNLEVARGNKQDMWSVCALWGGKVVRPEGVVKILG